MSLAGCLATDPAPVPQEGPYEVTYDVQGPLLIEGLTHGGSLYENTTLTITLGEPQTVADATARPVQAVNVTYTTPSGAQVTHWLDPATGRIITASRPSVGDQTSWKWTPTGEEGVFGLWHTLQANGSLPQTWTYASPESRALPANATSTMHLVKQNETGTPALPEIMPMAENWTPPESWPGPRFTWNHHYPPEGEHERRIPLTKALDEARDRSEQVARFMDTHPDWQVVSAEYFINPGFFVETPPGSGEKEDRWDVYLKASGGEVLRVLVQRQAVIEPVDTYLVDAYEPEHWTPGHWVDAGEHELLGVGRLWEDLVEFDRLGTGDTFTFSQRSSRAGPVWSAGMVYYDYEAAERGRGGDGLTYVPFASRDVETGLLSFYSGVEDPLTAFGGET